MKKIAILGSLGMAGHMIYRYLEKQEKYQLLGVARNSGYGVSDVFDVLNYTELEIFIKKNKPDYIVNCIGVLIKQSNENIVSAIKVNSLFPHVLEEMANIYNFKIIHISTDCVFSGKKGNYSENDIKDGEDNYSKTKALGELDNDRDFTIRTSIIGPELKETGTGLLNWFLKSCSPVNGFTGYFWNGITTLELARIMDYSIENDLSGVCNVCSERKISKFDLLNLFVEILDHKISVLPEDRGFIDKSLVCTRSYFKYKVPEYRKMLVELKQWMEINSELYPHYKETR